MLRPAATVLQVRLAMKVLQGGPMDAATGYCKCYQPTMLQAGVAMLQAGVAKFLSAESFLFYF
jgi:hypothetical protein